jgi:hypothetical protein
MKVTRSQWLLVTAACLIVASSAAQTGADRPPGVDESNWVPLSATAGIVLTNPAVPGAIRLRGRNVEPRSLTAATGTLMVKLGGVWTRVELEPPAPRVHPLL